MNTMPKFTVVGSLNMDLVTRLPRFPLPGETLRGSSFRMFPGGKGANQAVALARLGAEVAMVGLLGDDMLGKDYRATLEREGVDASGVGVVAGSATGTASIEVAETGENHIVIIGGANDRVDEDFVRSQAGLIRSSSVLLMQLEIPDGANLAAARIAAEAGVTILLDPAPAREIPAELLKLVDVITPNETEAALLTGADTSTEGGIAAAILALRSRGVKAAIVKAGADGAWYSEGGQPRLVPAFPVRAVDTVAAGDSFNAGLAFALGSGRPLAEAISFANATGGLSTTKEGAQSAMPRLAEVEELMDRGQAGR
jgi:ribokinase